MSLWRRLTWPAAVCVAGVTIVAALAPHSGKAAIVNNLLLQIATASAAMLAVTALMRRWRPALVVALALVGQAVMMAPGAHLRDVTASAYAAPGGAADDQPVLRVITYNVLGSNRNYDATVDFLRRQAADVVLLNEVHGPWFRALSALSDIYPYTLDCSGVRWCNLAVLSRLPLDDTYTGRPGSYAPQMADVTVRALGRDVRILGTHLIHGLVPGGFARQGLEVERVIDRVNLRRMPTVLAGDFNMAPWAPRLRAMADRAGLAVTPSLFGTWPAGLPMPARIPIDHVLVSPDLQVTDRRLGPALGSDHRPVIATIALAAH